MPMHLRPSLSRVSLLLQPGLEVGDDVQLDDREVMVLATEELQRPAALRT